MNVFSRFVTAICLICAIGAIAGGARAQQVGGDIWRVVPSNSLVVAAFDGRPDNPSIQAINRAQDPEAREMMAKQQAAMRKAVEDFATLFGISLDFTKDFESWEGDQWAIVLLPDGKNGAQPVLMIASKDADAANAALRKMLAPWDRVGSVTEIKELDHKDSGYPISSFKARGIEVYASAFGPVAAFSTSLAGLSQALKGAGFAAGSGGEKVFKALSGSMFCAYADPSVARRFKIISEETPFPVTGIGLGVSAVDTGIKLRVLAFPDDNAAAFLKQILGTQATGALAVNPGVPGTSLVAASLPNLGGAAAMAGSVGFNSPMFSALQALSDVQLSAAITAALPSPSGVITAMANSEQAASEKLKTIGASLKQMKLTDKPAATLWDDHTWTVTLGKQKLYLTHSGKYILLASGGQSLASAISTIKGEKPGVAESDTYKETMAGLGESNLLTLYVNLAPIQGLGFLAEGLGMGQMSPLYGEFTKGLENVKAMGIGVGFDGEMASVDMFCRAKPSVGTMIGPATIASAAIGAAVAFPALAHAREHARQVECQSNMKNLAICTIMYACDHHGKLPTAANWRSQLKEYYKRSAALRCPDGSIYAFNKNLGGLNLNEIEYQSDTVMFFEAKPGLPNASGSRANASLPHHGVGAFAYVDGRVESSSQVPAQKYWVPKIAAPKALKKAAVRKKAGVGR